MDIYVITGFQPLEAPHWEHALIEAESVVAAREALLSILTGRDVETVWGWSEYRGDGYQDPANWIVDKAQRPIHFVLGGGCR
jgi:hypothetical protein